jgi:hypothetical protein
MIEVKFSAPRGLQSVSNGLRGDPKGAASMPFSGSTLAPALG